MATETTETTPETLDTLAARLDHLDTTVHEVLRQVGVQQARTDDIHDGLAEVVAFIDKHREPLEKALRFLDPGRSMRDYIKGRPRHGG